MEDAIHRQAAAGYSRAAGDYVQGRPDYPPAIVGWLRDRLGLGPGATVAELGAGTGKFTPRLLETGARVLAVEPVAAMRARLSADLPAVEAVDAAAESLPMADGSVDAVACAQSFHWFANPAALAEIRRVLRPGGVLGLVWNVRDRDVGWVARLDAIVDRLEGDAPRFRSGAWRALFPAPGFGPLRESRFPHGHTGPAEDVIVRRIASTSFVAALPAEARAEVDRRVRELIASEPELDGGGVVTVPYETLAFDAARLAD